MYMSVAGPFSKFKNIEGLIVYVSPDTTDPKIIELKNFILSQTEKEITLNNIFYKNRYIRKIQKF